ncbi:unnamed protein product [Sphenostylis stenocarpa]|uniref:Uncharacterized protein n=1 Tax=Sphenostylis stenocarpa TaxID=92480 RepID=A0AA86VHX9_9FABA|nr:unnamed protein product [Sphenostylis stenocarpa]
MGSIADIRVDTSIGGKSKEGRNIKDDVQATTKEGSRFWKKLKIFLGCMLWISKGEGSSNKVNRGRVVTNDIDHRCRPKIQRSSSNTRLSSNRRSCPDQELIVASLLLRRFTFHDLMLATRSFKVENFFDEEGFGILLKGWINPYGNYAARPGIGIPIAVKALNFNGLQHHNEWLAIHNDPQEHDIVVVHGSVVKHRSGAWCGNVIEHDSVAQKRHHAEGTARGDLYE